LLGVGPPSPPSQAAVEVRYTSHGVAHVYADDLGGAAEGYGWALARDNLCIVAERMVTLAGERSLHLPPSATYFDAFAGGTLSNADSDAAFRYLLSPAMVRRTARGASRDMHAMVRGYVRGFNRHVAGAALPGEDCRKAAWFRPLAEDDIWRRIAHVPLLETTSSIMREMVAAAPPVAGGAASVPALPMGGLAQLGRQAAARGGSNAAAFGRQYVPGGVGGMSFANPHYAWHGSERLHAFHLTVRGEFSVFGATAYGLPFPMMGFTEHVGWGITHTTDRRSTLYELTLDPASPTRYRVGDQVRAMRPVPVTVPTSEGPRSYTFWETDFGTVIAGDGLAWTRERAYAFLDPQRGNNRFADQFLSIARSRDVTGIRSALLRHMGSPWSNTTAADRTGSVLYGNVSVAGNITNAQLEACLVTSAARRYMDLADVTVLDAARPGCAWTRERDAAQPGIIPARRRPVMIRDDATWNSNDSHWLAGPDPAARLEGYAQVIGEERSVRGERTRVAALYARQMLDSGGATPERWESAFFGARNLTAELMLDDLLADCAANPSVKMPDGAAFDLAPACTALRQWDRRDTLQSRGSALFVEFLRNLKAKPMTGFAPVAAYWRVPFDVADPLGTPRGFVATEETRQTLARAAQRLVGGQIPLDAPLGDIQGVIRNGKRIPLSGSSFAYHMVRPGAFAAGQGITEIRGGDSYIHMVSLTPAGVRGRFIVSYSQSTNPASPHFSDMTEVFSQERLLDVAFSPAEVAAAQVGETVVLGE
jgi:acyl-homoserine-lactone acylase